MPPVTAHAKTHPHFPVPPVTARKKDIGTIAFPTLPEDCLVLLLFYYSWGQINQSESTYWAYF